MAVSSADVPKIFEHKSWKEHCEKCQYGEVSPDGTVWCHSPIGSMGCFEYYREKED